MTIFFAKMLEFTCIKGIPLNGQNVQIGLSSNLSINMMILSSLWPNSSSYIDVISFDNKKEEDTHTLIELRE